LESRPGAFHPVRHIGGERIGYAIRLLQLGFEIAAVGSQRNFQGTGPNAHAVAPSSEVARQPGMRYSLK
jgi:hypothetical protein